MLTDNGISLAEGGYFEAMGSRFSKYSLGRAL